MAAPRVVIAGELVADLTGAGVYATTSPADLVANLPGVLVPPPSLTPGTYAGPTAEWRLVAVAAADGTGDPVAAWAELDDLLTAAWAVLEVERADPSSYALPSGSTHPAYVLTITTPGA